MSVFTSFLQLEGLPVSRDTLLYHRLSLECFEAMLLQWWTRSQAERLRVNSDVLCAGTPIGLSMPQLNL